KVQIPYDRLCVPWRLPMAIVFAGTGGSLVGVTGRRPTTGAFLLPPLVIGGISHETVLCDLQRARCGCPVGGIGPRRTARLRPALQDVVDVATATSCALGTATIPVPCGH